MVQFFSFAALPPLRDRDGKPTKRKRQASSALVGLLTTALFVACPTDTHAQQPSPRPTRDDKTRKDFNNSNVKGWEWVTAQCSDPASDKCAQAAISEVDQECAASAKFFKRDTRAWTVLGFALVAASAAFTGVGASTTIANAKVYSTLGGTTGLGAVTSTVNANVAGDQAGLATVNTTLANFLKFVQTGGSNNSPADNKLIYKSAPIYAAECSAAANGSSASSSK